MMALVLTTLAAAASEKCSCTQRGQDAYGSYCASWDAADEKPWCAVRSAAACSEDATFESKQGLYWSRGPCAGMRATPPKPADRSTRSGGGGGRGGGSSSSRPPRDAMVGYATGYGVDAIWPLAAAFHAVTKDNADLVLFVTLAPAQRKVLQARFPRIILLHPDAVLPPAAAYRGIDLSKLTHAAFRRYAVTAKWLDSVLERYARIIMTDTRDIALYDDPFAQVDLSKAGGGAVQSFTEVVTYRHDHWYNQGWVRNCYGQPFLDSIMEELVTCCGTVAASAQGLRAYLHAFMGELARVGVCDKVGTDTAVHVWIIHKLVKGARVVDSETSLIRHAPKWGGDASEQFNTDASLSYDARGRLLNKLGKPFALIHQADRFDKLWLPYIQKYANPDASSSIFSKLPWTTLSLLGLGLCLGLGLSVRRMVRVGFRNLAVARTAQKQQQQQQQLMPLLPAAKALAGCASPGRAAAGKIRCLS